MKNITEFLNIHLWKITTVVFALLFISKGCTNNKISNLDKKYEDTSVRLEHKIDSLQAQVSKMPTEKQVRDQMERVMFDYLIYEDDLDKGKSSLSDVKNKIEIND